MKYIRTENGIYEVVGFDDECIIPSPIIKMNGKLTHCSDYKNYKQADTIEELCDAIVRIRQDKYPLAFNLVLRTIWESKGVWLDWCKRYIENIVESVEGIGLYGAIWCDTGLKYVAKLNDRGELELI